MRDKLDKLFKELGKGFWPYPDYSTQRRVWLARFDFYCPKVFRSARTGSTLWFYSPAYGVKYA